jgi:hypothetical protein
MLAPNFQLVAVDLRCAEARRLAQKLLPVTTAVFGHRRIYRVCDVASAEQFVDPATKTVIVEIQVVTLEFANVAESSVDPNELRKAVARLSAFCLAWRHCEGAVDGDDESLVRALDDVTDPRVTDRIVLWLGCHPSVDTVYDA